MIHPNNHLERLRLEKKKNEKKLQIKEDHSKSSRLWRAKRERDKVKETEDAAQSYLAGVD